jgi:hypothetical protein
MQVFALPDLNVDFLLRKTQVIKTHINHVNFQYLRFFM